MSVLNSQEPRKRRRTTIVCNVCKARKVRCDKNTPCSSCVKHNTAHLCSYSELEAPEPKHRRHFEENSVKNGLPSLEAGGEPLVFLAPITASKVLSQFTDYASVVGVNPLNGTLEKISFFSDYSSMSYDTDTGEEMNHGPFSWHSIVRVDPALADVWSFILDIKPTKRVKVPSVYRKNTIGANAPLQLMEKIRQHSEQRFDPTNAKLQLTIPLGLTFKDPYRNKTDASHDERLLAILPSKRVLWTHIDRFFHYIYPFYPFLDETHFRTSIERIFGLPEYLDLPVVSVNVEGRLDFAHIGVLCLVLRMSYLSLISNDVLENTDAKCSASDDKDRHLLLCPIGIEFVDFSRFCLNQSQISNRASLFVMQLVVYMRIYMEVAPEDPDGPGRDLHQVNNGVLLQLAYSIGLNREPDKMMDMLNNPRLNNVRRKLWMFVTSKDYNNLIKFGTPFTSLDYFSDTNFPYLDSTNANSDSDPVVMSSIQPLEKLRRVLKAVLKNVLIMNQDTLIAEFITNLNQLEVFIYETFGTMKDFHLAFQKTDPQSLAKVLQLQYYIQLQIFMVSCYFRLYLLYESQSVLHLSFFYLKKMFVILAVENLPYFSLMLEQPHPYYRYAYQFVMNPHIEYFMHKSVGFFAAIISRLGYQIVETNPSDYSVSHLKVLMRSLVRCTKLCLLGIHKINHRYCYAWRIGTTFTYILRVLMSEGFYKRDFNRTADLVVPKLPYTDDQIVDLIHTLQPPIANADLSLFEVYWRTVADLIKLNQDDNKETTSGSLFNPCHSEIVFAGAPLQGPDERYPDGNSNANLFPNFDFQSGLTDFMGTFFEGPESYFDSFSSIPRNEVVDDYGALGRFS